MEEKYQIISANNKDVCYNVLKKRGEVILPKYKSIKILIGGEYYNEYQLDIKGNTYQYEDESCLNKIILLDEKIEFIRENDEFLLVMNNKKETAFYKLKEQNYELDIKINYFDSVVENNNLIISYQLDTTEKDISLILESGE